MTSPRALKQIPKLKPVSSTLLIPLVARGRGASIYPWLDPCDVQAQQLMDKFGHAIDPLLQDRATMLNVLWRTQVLKRIGEDFFKHHSASQGINLGAGLSDYFQWFDNGHNRWLDVDLREVVSLRHLLLQAHSETASDVCLDLTQPGWWQQLGLSERTGREPLLLLCEGVLMYLTPTQVKAVLTEIGDNAPEGSELVCDFMTSLGIGHAHLTPSVSSTGAEFQWGAHNAMEVAQLHPRLELLAQHTVAELYGWAFCWAEMCMTPWTGGPLYGVAHMQVTEP
ncbi:MAG: class I SAM-dependent methyltransferase [Pseudomonadota bacterium]